MMPTIGTSTLDTQTKRFKGLSSKEICDILITCNQAKVSKFKYRDLEVTFGADQLKISETVINDGEDHSRQEQLKAKLEENESKLDYLAITDPAAYEEFIVSEDAIDDQGRSTLEDSRSQ